MDRDFHLVANAPICKSIALVLLRIAELADEDVAAGIVEVPRDGQSIPTIVSPATENKNVPHAVRQHPECNLCGPPCCIFHQDNSRNLIFLYRQSIDLPNLFSR